MARAGFNKFKQAAFLKAFASTGCIRQSCDIAGVKSTFTHYNWLEKDPEYRPRFEAAIEKAIDVLEAEAWQRAIEKKRVYKFTAKGEAMLHPETGLPYYEEKEDSVLLKWLLSSLKEKYREKTETTLNGNLQHSEADVHRIGIVALLADPNYVEFLRHNAVNEDCNPGLICEARQPGDGHALADGSTHGEVGPGINGHRNGSE